VCSLLAPRHQESSLKQTSFTLLVLVHPGDCP
jgi:hypothetical protein